MKKLAAIFIVIAMFLTACDVIIEKEPITDGHADVIMPERVGHLNPGDPSDTEDGAVKYGAVIKLGELDEIGRSTYAHILVSDEEEPGSNGEEREETITVDPAGWKNEKKDGEWIYNRCHLIGYQFSGLNDEVRNLAQGTAYVNKGAYGDEMDEENPDSMLYYEQRLDDWLREHRDLKLDLYVSPIYAGESDYCPAAFYMQWIGIAENGQTVPISIGGKEQDLGDGYYGVWLENKEGEKWRC